ncbi:sugar phosphate isomerase/epimerase family protein [Kineosporia babensis]|uniref:Sugar phosphate isomerase/epimerase n=1 Tax=Kineosporia babensis TaxID=499548 RepID=A0A9X1NDI5_9ACTN|nr:sugar phosphate isomerase/epimerase [Kineosporia babensis]MCD5312113.1 sugar phosphate isomerase/epimerase [Kineosporia babensis]
MAKMHRLSINPLPWILGDLGYHLNAAVVETALRELKDAGYTAMTVEWPGDMEVSAYGALFAQHGMAPAPGYFSGSFQDASQHAALVEGIKRHAEAHAHFGLDQAFIAADLTPQRIAAPAVGAEENTEASAVIAEGMALAAEAAASIGVHYGLHPHVGSLVEVESEVRAVLDRSAGSALGFGPDTGHLAWAGADPVAVIGDYADRVVAIHVKDVDPAARLEAIKAGDDYMAATQQRHVWTEPGRGQIDFGAVLAALPEQWNGWTVVEVDVPNLPSRLESSTFALEYLRGQDFYGGTPA